MTRKKLDPDLERAAILLLQGGTSRALVQQMTGFSEASVRLLAHDLGVPRSRKYSAEFVDAVLARLRDGERATDIAADLGIHRALVAQWRAKAGLGMRRLTTVSDELRAEIVRRLSEGESNKTVALDYGLEERHVSHIRAAAGLPLRPQRERTTTQRPPRPITADERDRALRMLEGGASYNEVGKTFDRRGSVYRRLFPGFGWTREQVLEYARARRHLDPDNREGDVFKVAFARSPEPSGSDGNPRQEEAS